jgi:hypothetical protein
MLNAEEKNRSLLRFERVRAAGLRGAVMVDGQDDAVQPSGKMESVVQAGDNLRNGFSHGFRRPRPARQDCQESVRFPREPSH